LSKIKILITKECANHDRTANGITNSCCQGPENSKQCIYFLDNEDPRCKYFEEAVLPLEPELTAVYYAEIKARADGFELNKYQKKLVMDAIKLEAKCQECGKVFNPSSRRQKTCDYCRKWKIREQARIRKQNQRKGA